MTTIPSSSLAPDDSGDTSSSAIAPAELAGVSGGVIPIGYGGGAPATGIHLLPLHGAGAPEKTPPRCQSWKTWNSPQGVAITSSGGLTRFPLLSCPAIKRWAPPKLFGH